LTTNDQTRSLAVPPKTSGLGSSANGGELLFLALATCYCNDIYREAEKQGIRVESVDVTVEGEFGAPGEPARDVAYRARVIARASADEIRSLMQATDRIAEIQNTLRVATPVTLAELDPVPIS
jgi:organic hydroperoxide reductase OsmC/OhrA